MLTQSDTEKAQSLTEKNPKKTSVPLCEASVRLCVPLGFAGRADRQEAKEWQSSPFVTSSSIW